MKVLLLVAALLPFISCQVGGPIDYQTDLTDPNVIFAVKAINDLYTGLGDNRARTAVQLISATSQVVSGAMYTFEIEITGGDTNEICIVRVWSQPWLPEPDATKIDGDPKCTAVTVAAAPPAPVPGGPEPASLSDADVQKALQAAEAQINSFTNHQFYMKAIDAVSVTKQVTDGITYSFNQLAFAATSCSQSEAQKGTNQLCTVPKDAQPTMTCSATVYWNPKNTIPYYVEQDQCQG